MLLHNSFVSI